MGKAHSNAFKKIGYITWPPPLEPRLVGIAGRNEEAVGEAAKRYGYEYATRDWQELVADDRIGLFDNGGPNSLHAEPTIAAAEAGKHVVCEKPLGRDADEAYEIWRRVAATGVKHLCGFNYRFVPAVRLAREMIEAGELGEIRHFRGRYLQDWGDDPSLDTWRFQPDAAGSGALGDLGAHSIDLAQYLTGQRIERVGALLETFVEFFSLLGCEHFADFVARLAKFPAQFRLQQFPIHLRPFLAFTHDRVELLVLFRSQGQKTGETAQHFDSSELRGWHRLRLASLFHQQTAGENTGAEDDHGRQDDLPGVHQLLSTSSADARSVCSKSWERLAPERGRFKPEKDQTLSRMVTATQAAAPRQSAAPHCDRASSTRRAASRARMRFSNAYGTRSLGGFARAAANSFFWSLSRFITPILCQTPAAAQWLPVLVARQLLQALSHFGPGAKSANFHQGHRPAGKFGDFLD